MEPDKPYGGIIQQQRNCRQVWCYWKFSICQDWGSKDKMMEKYPNAHVYDYEGNRVQRETFPPLRVVK